MENDKLVIINAKTINTKDINGNWQNKLVIFTQHCKVIGDINAQVILAAGNFEVEGDICLMGSMEVLGNLKAKKVHGYSIEVGGTTNVQEIHGTIECKGELIISNGCYPRLPGGLARYQFDNKYEIKLPPEIIAVFPENFFEPGKTNKPLSFRDSMML